MYVRDTDSTRSLWAQPGHRLFSGLATGSSRLSRQIHEFERALRGTPWPVAWPLKGKIRSATCQLDLWHLRNDVRALVTQAYDKWEAQIRLDDLDSLFDTSAARGNPN